MPQVHDRPRHVGVSALIDGDGGSLGQPKKVGNTLGVDQIL